MTAIDQLHRLLRLVGLRDLRGEEFATRPAKCGSFSGRRTGRTSCNFSCIEIRHCGARSVQIVRRMRSMLENLVQTLPPHRHAELHLQLELLDCSIEASYTFPEDLAIARIPDSQGLGGSSSAHRLCD